MHNATLKVRLNLIVTIVDRAKARIAMDLFKSLRVHWHYTVSGEGTASSEVMEMLGLGSSDKTILLCIEPAHRVEGFLKTLIKELQLNRNGNGIAFSLPISGVSHPVIQKIEEEISMEMKENMGRVNENQKVDTKYSVVIGILNQGYSEEVMDTARANKVTGGTIVHARRVGIEDAVKFLGISLQEEKEILMMVTTKENRHVLMKELSSKYGVRSEVKGVYLSLPVEEIAGFELD